MFLCENVARIQERLTERQAEELFNRICELDRKGHSILSPGQTIDTFKDAVTRDTSKILLSAVYEATTGERFGQILKNEFDGIPDEGAQTLYLYLCGLFNFGVPVPEELLRRMYGRVRARRLRTEALAGILYVRQRRVWPRYRVIAELLWNALNPDIEAAADVFHDFSDHLQYELKETDTNEVLGQFCNDVFERVICPFPKT